MTAKNCPCNGLLGTKKAIPRRMAGVVVLFEQEKGGINICSVHRFSAC